ncbi:Major Facilitator Superfamily protein [Vibrio aerogenes CECT 7868]|uniref:Major Facilitator Superfamily protein n=1 Tax=Vibrio aerogenes CECT 7868 TaxID=1216006 RepID=A0A1M6DEN6_9VIBR|nr:MFS transporter [Vibrio aerogenes]SHI71569.1 Major Facilitator Superfamily protein [Vibrio aerogenes CECT 7868]
MNRDRLETMYGYLVNEEDARACKAIPESACKEVPGNFMKIIFAQFFTKLGDALINPKVTLPWIMQSIGIPASFVAWLVPIRESGSLLPQLVIASYIRRLSVRKWVWVCGSLLQAVAVLAIGLVAMSFEGNTAGWAILLLLSVFSLARGLNSVASKDVLGKTIPKSQRGQVNGWSGSASGFVTLIFAGLMAISHFSGWQGSGVFYGGCLISAAVVWLIGAMIYGRIEEYEGETEGGKNGLLEALKQCHLLWTDRAFLQFVLTRTLFLCTALSAPYYVLLAQKNHGNDIWMLALFMFASGLASLLAGPFWGKFADKSSKKVMMLGASMSAVTGGILFVIDTGLPGLTQSYGLFPALYFMVCIAHDGVRVGRKTYLVDLSEGNQRTRYVAVSNTVIGLMLLLMSSLGLLTQLISLSQLVLVFSAVTIAGVLLAARLPDVSRT